MSSTTLINLQVNAAAQFKEMVSEPSPNTVLYMSYGRTSAWANDAFPDIANSSVVTSFEVWKNMIGAKKITANDIRHAIPRYNWIANTSYIAFDDKSTTLFDDNVKFYVLTSAKNVYKCLSNNNSIASLTEPTSTNPNTTTQTADGYTWKYMYSLSDQDQLRYMTTNYMPVKTLSNDDGSNQWDVQQGAIDGAISSIIVTNPGSGYSNASNITITITGDGMSATATASINSATNTITTIALTNPGISYRYATVSISGGAGSGATARTIMSPIGGHGVDALYELGGHSLIFNPRLIRDENVNFPVTNNFRQIALIIDPLLSDGVTRADNTAIFAGYTIASAGSGDYVEDEFVYQGPSLATASFTGRILSWNTSTGIATVVNQTGTPTTGTLIGANSAITRFLTSAVPSGLAKYSGKILYVDNILPITRSSDQTEDFKIILHLN